MTHTILVATDGSDGARSAVALAGRLAGCLDANLTVLHVLLHGNAAEEAGELNEVERIVPHVSRAAMPRLANVPATMGEVFSASQSAEETARIVTVLGERIVENAALLAKQAGAAKVDTRVLGGDYAGTILDTADDIGADMIVVGSRGLGRLRELLVGSVSHKVQQHAKCTVVTVR